MLETVISDIANKMSSDIHNGVEDYIKECMEKGGTTMDELSCYVLEWYPVEFNYNEVNGRVSATQQVRLRHKTNEELAQEKE